MNYSYSLKNIIEIIHGDVISTTTVSNEMISSIVTDSRKLKAGDIFIALKGNNFDGHDFIMQAAKLGASAVIIDSSLDDLDKFLTIINTISCPVILVDDSLRAYGEIAYFHRNQLINTTFIGITGSVGKTTTKNLLGHCLNAVTPSFYSHGNFNNFIGVPYNILEIDKYKKFAVSELGMQYTGEIKYLSLLLQPNIAIINNISESHLYYFKNLKGIAEAKSEIFFGLQKDGIVILNGDMQYFELIHKKALKAKAKQIITYGHNSNNPIQFKEYVINRDNSCMVYININGEELEYQLPLASIALIENSLIVFALFYALKLPFEKAIFALKDLPIDSLKGRGQIIKKKFDDKSIIIIDETYNAGYAAMVASLKNLSQLPFANENVRRRVAILGEMKELGPDAKMFHEKLIAELNDIDLIITLGGANILALNKLINVDKNGGHYANLNQLLDNIKNNLQDGDLILIKGANSLEMWKIIDLLSS